MLACLCLTMVAFAGCTEIDEAPADVEGADDGPAITGILVSGIGATRATVTWTVTSDAEDVTSHVEYAAPGGESASSPVQRGTGEQTVVLKDLSPGTLYEYQVVASDGQDQESVSRSLDFGTDDAPGQTEQEPDAEEEEQEEEPDAAALSILDVVTFHAGQATATIHYTVAGGEGAVTSQVRFGQTDAYGETTETRSGTGQKEVTIDGLQPDTTYHYQVTASDAMVTTESGDNVFTTTAEPDTDPPVIADIAVEETTTEGVTLAWTVTDAGGVKSWVTYGVDDLSQQTEEQVGSPQTVTIEGLDQNTTYQYQVHAEDGAGNTNQSTVSTFTTDVEPPTISSVATQDLLLDRFTVTFSVAGPPDTETKVEYGTDDTYGNEVPADPDTGDITVTLTDLAAATEYHFRVVATAQSGTTESPDQTQWTAELVDVSIDSMLVEPYFSPDPLSLVADRPYIFEVTNNAGEAHIWGIREQVPDTENLNAGDTYRYSESYTLAAGDYEQYCGYHSSMTGTVTVT